MKTLYFILVFVFFSLAVFAQDANYTGPAKVQVKMFWTQIEKLKAGTGTASTINNAERAIKMIKENDKAYNTEALEAAIKPMFRPCSSV